MFIPLFVLLYIYVFYMPAAQTNLGGIFFFSLQFFIRWETK
jgi:hypothetical protein